MATITLQLVPDFNVQQRMYKSLPMEAFIDGFREMVSSVDSFSAGPNFYTGTVNHLLRKTRTLALRARAGLT